MPKICKLFEIPEIVILAVVFCAINLNQAELLAAPFHEQPEVFESNISEG